MRSPVVPRRSGAHDTRPAPSLLGYDVSSDTTRTRRIGMNTLQQGLIAIVATALAAGPAFAQGGAGTGGTGSSTTSGSTTSGPGGISAGGTANPSSRPGSTDTQLPRNDFPSASPSTIPSTPSATTPGIDPRTGQPLSTIDPRTGMPTTIDPATGLPRDTTQPAGVTPAPPPTTR